MQFSQKRCCQPCCPCCLKFPDNQNLFCEVKKRLSFLNKLFRFLNISGGDLDALL